jgi:regulator of sirC expression with transglutaminase-like and TPR domain
MPGHFLLRDKVDPEVFVDPHARGAVLDRRGARARFHAVLGPHAAFSPEMLEPAPRAAIVARVLANLEGVAARRTDRDLFEWVLRLRTALPGAGSEERRRLATLLATSGRVIEAAEVLEALAGELTGVPAEAAAAAARRLRSRLN